MDFLDRIAVHVKKAIGEGYYDVEPKGYQTLSLKKLLDRNDFSLIPVIERAAPSAGVLFDGDAGRVAGEMIRAGAPALSIVCERDIFRGSMSDISLAKYCSVPVLYKDFVIDPVQIMAAKNAGADCVLLILGLFEKGYAGIPLDKMISYAQGLGLETLLEVFNLQEFEMAKKTRSDILGINNRDLKTLKVDISCTGRILSQSTPDRPVIAESGVMNRSDYLSLKATGAKAVLVGTSIMRSKNPGDKIKELLGGEDGDGP